MTGWFAAPWATVGFVAATTAAMYATTLVCVRLAGRRTVAQISAFDVLVTIAIGTLLGSTALSRDPSYAQGATALVTLLILQVAVAAARRRFPRLQRLLDFRPIVVVRDGETRLPAGPLGPQMTHDELASLLRRNGVFGGAQVRLVVLEPGGQVSVDPAAPPADVAG